MRRERSCPIRRCDWSETGEDAELGNGYAGLWLARQFDKAFIARERPRNNLRAGPDVVRIPHCGGGGRIRFVTDFVGEDGRFVSRFGEKNGGGQARNSGSDDCDTLFHFGGESATLSPWLRYRKNHWLTRCSPANGFRRRKRS